MCDRSGLAAEAKAGTKQDGQAIDKAFRRLSQKVDGLTTQILRRCDEIMDGMPEVVAHQTLIAFLAASLMKQNEQTFRWLLESPAAMKIQEIDAAKANLREPHPTAH